MAVPAALLQSMASASERAGIPVPEVSKIAPTIDVTKPIRALALELGQLLSMRNIFLRNDVVVEVDETSGALVAMDAKSFPSWVEEFCVIIAPGSRRVRDSISVDDAGQILASKIFRACLRPLKSVNTMRLPVMRKSGTVEWLAEGYDVESEIFTIDLLPYPMDWQLGQGQEFFLDTCSHFPWNKKEGEAKGLHNNRSFSVHIGAMVGAYVRGFFAPGTLMPILSYFGNKAGTGETRLAEMVQVPVYGMAAAIGTPKDEEKMEVKLETIAQSMRPFAFFDDIGSRLRSNALNRFTSEAHHSGRKFHSNSEMFEVPNVTQAIITANDLKTSEDLGRRALVAELFLDEEVKGRKFPYVITSKWLQTPETRVKFLAAMCALVKHWIAQGMVPHPSPIPTYEEWTEIVGGIVLSCEFCDPLTEPEGDVGGAMDEDEIKQLLRLAADAREDSGEMDRKELIAIAQAAGLLEDLLGTSGDVDDSASKSFGRRMQRWRGQKLTDHRGRSFQFSHKKKKAGAVYPITFL